MINNPRHCEKPQATKQSSMRLWIASLTLAMTMFLWVAPANAKPLPIEEITSPGGIKAWLVQDSSIPVIAVDFAFKGAGSQNETLATQGLARMLSNTLDEGAGELESKAFQKELLDRSISLSFNAGRDDFSGELKTLSRHKARAFELLKLALTQPRFDTDAVERMRQANMSRIRTSLADPEWIAARLMNDTLYKGHAYALNTGGTLSTLPGITPVMLRAYLTDNLTRERLKIGVAGDITPAELGKVLDEIFGPLPAKAKAAEVPKDATLGGGGTVSLFEKDIPQTVVEISAPGIDHLDKAYHHAEILNFILGSSGFGSRLMEEIREKRGLTYGIYSGLLSMDHADILTVSTSTKNASAKDMLDLIRAEFTRLKTEGATGKELADAKSYLIGSVPLSLTSTDRISSFLLSLQMRGFGKNYLEEREKTIEETTLDDLKSIAQTLLSPDVFTVVLVGKPQGIENASIITALPNAE